MSTLDSHPDWLFLDKPAGLPVFPPHGDPAGDCLLARMLVEHPEQGAIDWPERFEGGLLHRLDTGTSGLVIAARDLDAFARGRAAFASHALHKRYRFLSASTVSWDRHTVDCALAHDKRRKSRMVWQRGANTPHRGRWLPARTELRRLGPRLWEATLFTGVMHQARIHAAAVGLPILGDRLYGGAPHPERFHLHHARIDGWPAPTPDVPIPDTWLL